MLTPPPVLVPPTLVLGATSLVGPFLLERLAASGRSGICTSRHPPAEGTPPASGLPAGFKWQRLDAAAGMQSDWEVEPGARVLSLLPLWHLASLLPRLAGAGQIVALGSTSVLAKTASPDPAERATVRDLADAEAAIAAFCGAAGMPWTVLRPTLIYDGCRDANVTAIARFIRRFGFFPVARPALGRRQPIHADDVAGAMVAALDNPRAGGRSINLPGGETLTYREMVRRVFIALDRPVRVVPLPGTLLSAGIGLVRRATGVAYSPALFARMNQDLAFDGGDAETLLGYAARPFRPSFSAAPLGPSAI